MFYGDFDPGKFDQFKRALLTIKDIFGPMYARDNLIALRRTAGFLQDARFCKAMDTHAETLKERSLAWRLHTLIWAAEQCLSVEGDFVECGVFKGFSFKVVTHYLSWEKVNKTLYLYDTFEGIPEEFNDEGRSNDVYQAENETDPEGLAVYKHVLTSFEKYPNVRVVKGAVPSVLIETCPEKIALLHIDMNSTKSEIAALEALWDRVVPGGMIVFDDYGWIGYRNQKVAEDGWMAERDHKILEMPTGQGLVIKKPRPSALAYY